MEETASIAAGFLARYAQLFGAARAWAGPRAGLYVCVHDYEGFIKE